MGGERGQAGAVIVEAGQPDGDRARLQIRR
jgi:hypothetical protein